MSVLVVVLLFLLGILLIVKGGDLFVDASTWIAVKSGIPKFIIGATIVSLATTLPELLTSAIATMDGKTGIAVGNAVGSVTANVGLIMGISVVCLPAVIQRNQIAFKGILMILACLLLYLLSSGGQLHAGPSMLLLVLFAVFIIENLYTAKKSMQNEKNSGVLDSRNVVLMNIAKFVGGAAGIVIGAQLLVNNGSELARILGVPESIIGATLIAVGTSLPELVTTVTALVKRQASLSIGNILGANIIDLTMILPICSILAGGSLEISAQASLLDLPFCLAVCFLAVLPPLFAQRFFRLQGGALLAVYAAYIAILCIMMV